MRGFVNRMLLKTIDQMFIDKRFQMRFNIYPLSNQSRNPPSVLSLSYKEAVASLIVFFG